MSFDDWMSAESPEAVKAVSKECECGSWKTYGKDVSATMHSDFCPIYEPKKENL